MNTASRYRLLARWASGGMADIYVARQQGMGGFDKIVALKFLRDVGDSSAFRDMFLEEVRTAALLNHPNIVQTFDADQLGERLFLAMEFVHGETLGRFARAVIESSGRFPVELAVAICRDIASALEYAHTLTNLEGVPVRRRSITRCCSIPSRATAGTRRCAGSCSCRSRRATPASS